MALSKLFQRIFFHNNTTPAINEDNLNAMSKGLSDVDDRLIELAGTIMEDVPTIQHDLEILEPAIENIDANVERAETAADNAEEDALKSEGYAVGKQDGVEVTSGEYYQNNARYYAEIANPPIENTVDFADIITVTDAINKAAKDVRLKVEAVQDLHGYTKPWVGGAGKNKFDVENAELVSKGTYVTLQRTASSLKISSSTATDYQNAKLSISLQKNTNYILTANVSVTSGEPCVSIEGVKNGTAAAIFRNFNTESISQSFNSGDNDTWNILFYCAWGTNTQGDITFNYPMVRLATETDATFAPYTNICPIGGWDNAKITRSGKNLLLLTLASLKANNPSDASKTWDGNKYTYSSVEFTPVFDSNGNLLYINVNTTENTHAAAYFFIYGSNAQSQPNIFKGMKLSGCPSGGSSSTYRIMWQSFETQIVYPEHLSGSDIGEGITISEDAYTRIYISIPANSVLNNVRFYPMIRLATVSDATYEPYQGEELTISLGGTRYGGTLDVTSGVLTVTHGFKELIGSEGITWTVYNSQSGTTLYSETNLLTGVRKDSAAIYGICSAVVTAANGTINNSYLRKPSANGSGIEFATLSSYWGLSENTSAALNAKLAELYLAGTPLQIVYELATPQTIQLTPTQVYLLYGYNTLFGDCGDISLTYDASGIIHIAEAKLDTETLKTIAAASSDFADFKARIAAL